MQETPPQSTEAIFSGPDLATALSRTVQKRWRVFDSRPHFRNENRAFNLPLQNDGPRVLPFTFQTEADDPKWAA